MFHNCFIETCLCRLLNDLLSTPNSIFHHQRLNQSCIQRLTGLLRRLPEAAHRSSRRSTTIIIAGYQLPSVPLAVRQPALQSPVPRTNSHIFRFNRLRRETGHTTGVEITKTRQVSLFLKPLTTILDELLCRIIVQELFERARNESERAANSRLSRQVDLKNLFEMRAKNSSNGTDADVQEALFEELQTTLKEIFNTTLKDERRAEDDIIAFLKLVSCFLGSNRV